MFGLQSWKAGSLLATWVAYWSALGGVTFARERLERRS